MKKIAVIAPANSIITEKDKNLINIGKKHLEKIGCSVEYQENIFSNDLFEYSASVESKIKDIISVSNKHYDVLICATGGINSNCILEYLDENILKNKFKNCILIGNSNNTILLNYLNKISNIKCYLGPNLKSLGKYPFDLSEINFENKIKNFIPQIILKKDLKILNNGCVSGQTFGGNGSALRRIAGTKYFPDFKNKIMILEFNERENTPLEVQSILSQYKQMGIFDSISGLILGEYSNTLSIEILMHPYIIDKNYPIVICKDFGHNCESTFIPIGSDIYINTYKNEIYEK